MSRSVPNHFTNEDGMSWNLSRVEHFNDYLYKNPDIWKSFLNRYFFAKAEKMMPSDPSSSLHHFHRKLSSKKD